NSGRRFPWPKAMYSEVTMTRKKVMLNQRLFTLRKLIMNIKGRKSDFTCSGSILHMLKKLMKAGMNPPAKSHTLPLQDRLILIRRRFALTRKKIFPGYGTRKNLMA